MRTVFPIIRESLSRGEQVVLCTILSSSGSTPRGPGAQMAVFQDGTIAGTIGGGAVERLAQGHASELLGGRRKQGVRTFQLYPNGGEDIGMICGGEVTVVFQTLRPADLPLVEQICIRQESRTRSWLVMAIEEQSIRIGIWEEGDSDWKIPGISQARVAPLLGRNTALEPGSPALFIKPLAQQGMVYIFGAGHVGRELVWLLDRVGFRVAVVDDRSQVLEAEQFPTGVQLILGDFGRIDLPLTESDYVVIMTAGHQGDLTILEQILPTPVTYIGCIGSRRKAAATQKLLKEKGFTEEQISRIHSPIGLPIGGETPAEIAVSVAAELIAHRAGKETRHG